MLSLEHNDTLGGVRLLIQTDIAPAWISFYPPSLNAAKGHDWRLYVRHKPCEPARSSHSATCLLIESRLRAWLLQRFRRRLRDLSFAELCQIAEHKALAPIEHSRHLEKKRIFERHKFL
jgi:hypothetical protein